MTKEEAKKMLKAKLDCLIRETSGTDIDCNNKNCDECNLCYEQGNMGEQKEALELAIKALDQEPSEDIEVIKVSKGAVKARQGRFVIYDVEWLKKNFYTTEEKIYGQPKQPCEDCISREAVINAVCAWGTKKERNSELMITMAEVKQSIADILADLPPVTPKYTDKEIDRAQAVEQAYIDKMVELTVEELIRPEGEWIDIEYFDREWTCYRPKCPFCNAEPKEYSNYCPNCGAKLKEEDLDY